ncbi:MAG TPA: hypothetical protein VEJ20_00245 [Candidatus Eremiobacteraceae bacterium]|nr:hypothetical protein [Candidatus Eremiobacteraceae bacterium]
MPRSRRWTTEAGAQEAAGTIGRGTTKWEPTLAFPKTGAHRATIGDRLFAEVHIDVRMQSERNSLRTEGIDTTGSRTPIPFVESVVYDYMGVQDGRTLVLRETSRQGERVERSMLYVRLAPDGPTKVRFPSGVLALTIDDEQVAVVRWIGP